MARRDRRDRPDPDLRQGQTGRRRATRPPVTRRARHPHHPRPARMISSRYEVLTNPGRTPGAFLPWRVVTGGGRMPCNQTPCRSHLRISTVKWAQEPLRREDGPDRRGFTEVVAEPQSRQHNFLWLFELVPAMVGDSEQEGDHAARTVAAGRSVVPHPLSKRRVSADGQGVGRPPAARLPSPPAQGLGKRVPTLWAGGGSGSGG